MTDEPISFKYRRQIEALDQYLRKAGGRGATMLLCIVMTSERGHAEANLFEQWMKRGSTLTLRKLAAPHKLKGQSDLEHFNIVDALDSAMGKLPTLMAA